MNAPLLREPLGIAVADLGDRALAAAIDGFVEAHADGTPFHLTAWSRAVEKGCGQAAHMLVAQAAGGRVVGVLPLTALHSPLFGRALVSAGFGVGGGILADDPAVVRMLGDAATRLAGQLGCPGVELRGGPPPSPAWHSDADSYVDFARPLAADDEAELKAIPRKQRAEVRKALANDLNVSVGRSASDLRAHYAVYSRSVRNLGTPVFPRALFTAMVEAFGEHADILTVESAGVPVASVLSLYWRGTVYPYWGGGTQAARGLRANDRMYFQLMRHARERDMTRFDFGRSKPGTGAAAFKKNWGFEPAPLIYHHHMVDGGAPRQVNPLNPKYRMQIALWKRLPIGVANLIGPWISRGLG